MDVFGVYLMYLAFALRDVNNFITIGRAITIAKFAFSSHLSIHDAYIHTRQPAGIM